MPALRKKSVRVNAQMQPTPLEWNSEMDLSSKCTLYKHLKAEFKLEPYLLKLSRDVF